MNRRTYLQCTTGVIGGTTGVSGGLASTARTQQATDGTLDQVAKIVADDGAETDLFGGAVAVSNDGSTAVAGAANRDGGGAAYVFARGGGSWTQQTKLTADDTDLQDDFGNSVTLSADGSTAVVAAWGEDDPNGRNAGAVYVFERVGGSWTQQAKLVADDGEDDDRFGSTVAVSGDGSTLVIGAYRDSDQREAEVGSAYVFERGGGSWSQQTKLTADDGEDGDGFGLALSLSNDGSTAVVGARDDESPDSENTGSAYVFERVGGSWSQRDKLTAVEESDRTADFGQSVSLSGDGSTVVVGAWQYGVASGAVYVFERAGDAWQQQTKLVADADRNDNLGWSVAVSDDGSTAIAGANGDEDPNGENAGSAYVFERAGGSWTQQTTLVADDGDTEDRFGDAVAVSGDGSTVVVGAWEDDDPNGERAGSAYVFESAGTAGGLPTDDPDFQDVLGVIGAYNDGTTYDGVEPEFQDVLAVIDAYNSS